MRNFVALFFILASSSLWAQDPTTPSDSLKIVTKVPFRGMNYFITIVPVDSTNIDKMPMYDPQSRGTVIWKDSVQRLFPDSILHFLPQRGNIFKKPIR